MKKTNNMQEEVIFLEIIMPVDQQPLKKRLKKHCRNIILRIYKVFTRKNTDEKEAQEHN